MAIPDNAPELSPHQAIEFYERATQADATNADNFLELGAAFYVAHRWDEAIAAFEKAVSLKPNLGHAHYYLGVLYAAKGDHARAAQELDSVLQVSENPILKAQAKARIPVVQSATQLAAS